MALLRPNLPFFARNCKGDAAPDNAAFDTAEGRSGFQPGYINISSSINATTRPPIKIVATFLKSCGICSAILETSNLFQERKI
jgi:hypothetical protein